MPSQIVVLITGASSGIGRATAQFLAQKGCRVFGTSRQPAGKRSSGFTLLPLDVRDPNSIRACVQSVLTQAGRLDVLVNNAGVDGPVGASEELAIDQWRALFDINFFGVVQMTNAVLPVMRRQGGGRIINVSSLAGVIGAPPFFSAYNASKFALEGYTETLRYEAGLFNIAVSLVEPGYFKTNIHASIEPPALPLEVYARRRQRVNAMESLAIEHGRNPHLVAQTIWQCIASPAPDLRYPVGSEAEVMTITKRLVPFAWIERFFRWLYLDNRIDPSRLGVRRVLIDAQFGDRVQSLALMSVGLAFLWRFMQRRRKR